MADAEIDTEVAAAPVEHVNPRDAVNDDVRAAIASLTAGAEDPPKVETTEQETVAAPEPAAQVERARGPDGKFLSKATEPTKDAAPAKAAAPDPKLPATDNAAKVSAPASKPFAPPAGWAADGRQAWATLEAALPTLPPAVQAALSAIHAAALKRDEAADAGFAQYSERTKAYERALAPIAQEAQRRGLSTEDGIKRLLDGETFFRTRPAEAIMWLAQQHGLNLAELAANPPAAPQAPARTEAIVPPQVLEQVSSLEQRFNQFFADQNARAVDTFAADPKNAHYAAVEDQLPDIMRELKAVNPALSGVPLLQAAYDRAIWLNQDVREKIFAERQAQTQQQQTQKVAAKAAQASRAAVSVKGSSADLRPPPKPNGAAGNHVTDDVRAAIEQLRAH